MTSDARHVNIAMMQAEWQKLASCEKNYEGESAGAAILARHQRNILFHVV